MSCCFCFKHFKREELNFTAQFEGEEQGGGAAMKTGKAAIAERKKKRREGKARNKESGSVVVQCLKRLLPVGLNIFGGRELEIVQHSKDRFLQVCLFLFTYNFLDRNRVCFRKRTKRIFESLSELHLMFLKKYFIIF